MNIALVQKIYTPKIVFSLFIIFLGLGAISIYESDEKKIDNIQYQSYKYSILSADFFKRTGYYLAVPSQTNDSYRRFEDITSDDNGYTIILSWFMYFNLIEIDKNDIEKLQAAGYQESRSIMKQNLSQKTAFLGVDVYIITVVLFFIFLIKVSKEKNLFSIVLLFIFLLLLPFLFQNLFIERMHSHSLIPTCVILTLFSACLIKLTEKDENKIHIVILLILSGVLLGFTDVIRHSQGIAALITLIFISFLINGNYYIKFTRIILLLIGLFIVNTLMLGSLNLIRDINLNIQEKVTGTTKHPYAHVLLTGISHYPNNSLNIRGEADVVKLVQEKAQKEVRQDSKEYLQVARTILFNYILSHPIEYIHVISSKLEQVPNRIGNFFRLSFTTVLFLSLLALLGLIMGFFIRKDYILFIGGTSLLITLIEMYIPITTNAHFSYGVATALFIFIFSQLIYWVNLSILLCKKINS